MKIGLLGFTFDHENLGCQALTCSFLEIVRKVLKNQKVEIVVFRRDQNLGVIPSIFKEFSFTLVRTKLIDARFTMINEIKKCDIIFDESYGDGFSDIYFKKVVYRDTIIKYIVAKSKIPFVLTPQTYGPFKDKKLKWLAGKVIKKADYVFSRDEISTEFARKISRRDHIVTVTDMAFSLPFSQSLVPCSKKRIGINISGLLWQGGFDNKGNQFGLITNYKLFCEKCIEIFLEKGFEVHLIPHVTRTSNKLEGFLDGDYPYCVALHNKFPSTLLAPNFANPYEAKNYISSMDVFIGARMHSTIASFSSGVITIPFAYSRKFQGLFNSLDYPFYIDGLSLSTEEAVEKTCFYIDQDSEIRKKLVEGNHIISKYLKAFEENLQEIFKEVEGKYNER